MNKQWLLLGITSGFFGVVFGAFGGHVLKETLTQKSHSVYLVGVQYQFLHSFALIALGLWATLHPTVNTQISGWAFTIGITLFSGSLYVLALTNLSLIGILTPIGGLSFMVGWASFALLVAKH